MHRTILWRRFKRTRFMKTLGGFFMVILIAGLVLFCIGAGCLRWTNRGKPVCTSSGNQNEPMIVRSGTGAIICWEDKRSGNSDIYAQRIDSNGARQWTPAQGVAICTASGDQTNPSMISDGDYGAIIAWVDDRPTNPDTGLNIYAQRILSDGSIAPYWPTNGVLVCGASNDQVGPKLVTDEQRGAIIAWQDRRSGTSDIYAKAILSDGTTWPGWGGNGNAICSASGSQSYVQMTSDESNGAIIAWVDDRPTSPDTGLDIYAQRVTANGTEHWTDNGKEMCKYDQDQEYAVIAGDGVGGAIIAWTDKRAGNRDIYALRINSSGYRVTGWSTNGNIVCTGSVNQSVSAIAYDNHNGAIVAWTSGNDPNEVDIYAQRMAPDGERDWNWDGVQVCTSSGPQRNPRITSTASGDGIVTWWDGKVYAQKVSAAGYVKWTVDGVALSALPSVLQMFPEIVSDGANGAIITWEDYPTITTSNIYAQRITD